mmetsp:Transcript_42107/g.75317  ORF Transcript_42107/g.75317 Transcript_42107/m.75317 type:complete len:291 (-) Transcript_42107:759-1631(-)
MNPCDGSMMLSGQSRLRVREQRPSYMSGQELLMQSRRLPRPGVIELLQLLSLRLQRLRRRRLRKRGMIEVLQQLLLRGKCRARCRSAPFVMTSRTPATTSGLAASASKLSAKTATAASSAAAFHRTSSFIHPNLRSLHLESQRISHALRNLPLPVLLHRLRSQPAQLLPVLLHRLRSQPAQPDHRSQGPDRPSLAATQIEEAREKRIMAWATLGIDAKRKEPVGAVMMRAGVLRTDIQMEGCIDMMIMRPDMPVPDIQTEATSEATMPRQSTKGAKAVCRIGTMQPTPGQ